MSTPCYFLICQRNLLILLILVLIACNALFTATICQNGNGDRDDPGATVEPCRSRLERETAWGHVGRPLCAHFGKQERTWLQSTQTVCGAIPVCDNQWRRWVCRDRTRLPADPVSHGTRWSKQHPVRSEQHPCQMSPHFLRGKAVGWPKGHPARPSKSERGQETNSYPLEIWSGRGDLNTRHPAPKSGFMPYIC